MKNRLKDLQNLEVPDRIVEAFQVEAFEKEAAIQN